MISPKGVLRPVVATALRRGEEPTVLIVLPLNCDVDEKQRTPFFDVQEHAHRRYGRRHIAYHPLTLALYQIPPSKIFLDR